MNNKRNKKNIFKRIVAFFGATFTAIACCFLLNKPNENINVYADEVVLENPIFYGSDLVIPTAMYQYYFDGANNRADGLYYGTTSYSYNNNSYSEFFPFLYTLFSVDFRFSSDTNQLEFRLNSSSLFLGASPDSPYYPSSTGDVILSNYTYVHHMGQNRSTSFSGSIGDWLSFSDYATHKDIMISDDILRDTTATNTGNALSGVIFELSGDLNFDVSKILGVELSFNNSRFSTRRCSYNVRYFDRDGRSILFEFACGASYLDYSSRTYYFSDAYNFTDNELYNQGYSQGTSDGYSNGFIQGKNEGYTNGYNIGKNEGYNLGYNQGLDGSGRWSFNNFLSAVIDVPVNAFTSLFNFDILGVNLAGFFTGLLTLGVVIAIIRLLLGR